MKKYIDCDGVILDTESGLFDEYYKLKKQNKALKKIMYLQQLDWKNWLHNARVINDSINIIREYDFSQTDILTKVHSVQEALAKINYFRERKVRNNIIIVPSETNKSKVVNASGNILVDDNEVNLRDWSQQGGFCIYFGTDISHYLKIN